MEEGLALLPSTRRLPPIGILVDWGSTSHHRMLTVYLLYQAFFVDCWKERLAGKSVVVFAVVWMIVGFFTRGS